MTSKVAPRDPSTIARDDKSAEQPIGGGILAGITHVIRRICSAVADLCSFTRYNNVFLLQANQDHRTSISRPKRAPAFFPQLDLVVNTLTLVLQLLITGT